MKKLSILVVGNALTAMDEALVTKSLMYFAEELSESTLPEEQEILSELLGNSLVFEDVVARKDVSSIREHADRFGYILALGNKAVHKLEHTSADIDVVECHTLPAGDWSGGMRERVIEQLKEFVKAWINMETENKVMKVAKVERHEVDWVLQNTKQFKRHIQLMIQNNRPHAVFFQDKKDKVHCILKDATKRLRKPIDVIVPIVTESSRVQEKVQKNLEQNGYKKIFFMDLNEFMSHVICMCQQMNGESVHIKVESA